MIFDKILKGTRYQSSVTEQHKKNRLNLKTQTFR